MDDEKLVISQKGKKILREYSERELRKGRSLIVIFDIPENRRNTRYKFRKYLKDLGFLQVQKSVWVSQKRMEEHITELIVELNIEANVRIYDSVLLYPLIK